MICAHCGREVSDYSAVCAFCGKNVLGDTPPAGMPGSMGEQQAPKKPVKKAVILIPVIAVLALLAVLVIVNGAFVLNWIRKATMTPEQYCQYVLKKNFAEDTLWSDLYDMYVYQRLQTRYHAGYSGELALQLSDDAIDLLQDKTGSASLEALGDLRFHYAQRLKEDQFALEAGLHAGKNDILSAELIYDGEEQILYGIVPELNKDYAKIDLEAVYGKDGMKEFEQLYEFTDRLMEIYPAPEEAQKMQERYLNAVIDEIGNVKERNEKRTVDGITQSFTVLTVQLDEEQLGRMITAVCDEALQDETLKNMVTELAEAGKAAGANADGEEAWEKIEEELEQFMENAEELDFAGAEYAMELYVSGTGKVQGIDFTMENEDEDETGRAYFVYVRKGKEIAVEGICGSSDSHRETELALSGKGTLEKGWMNGDFNLEGNFFDVDFRLENVDIAGLRQGHIGGDLVVELKQFKAILSNLGLKELKDQAFTVSLDMSEKSSLLELRLAEGEEPYAAVSLNSQSGSADDISIPEDSKCVSVTDEDEMQEYVANCDLDVLKEILEDAGLADILGASADAAGSIGGTSGYINQSRISADIQLADSIQIAVLTAVYDPDVVINGSYNTAFADLTSQTDITQLKKGDNVIMDAAAEILGVEELQELSGSIHSPGATGRILVTITGPSDIEVILEGTDDGTGAEIAVK